MLHGHQAGNSQLPAFLRGPDLLCGLQQNSPPGPRFCPLSIKRTHWVVAEGPSGSDSPGVCDSRDHPAKCHLSTIILIPLPPPPGSRPKGGARGPQYFSKCPGGSPSHGLPCSLGTWCPDSVNPHLKLSCFFQATLHPPTGSSKEMQTGHWASPRSSAFLCIEEMTPHPGRTEGGGDEARLGKLRDGFVQFRTLSSLL